jgi:hypothetical protein
MQRNKHPLNYNPIVLVLAIAILVHPGVSRGGGLEDIPICHGFGCRILETVSISESEWRQVRAFFREPAATPAEERDQIRRAVGWFDVIAGRYTPIHRDLAKNEIPGRFDNVRSNPDGQTIPASSIGQLDCIDESRNMTTYLTLIEQAGLFRHHRVVERALRRSAMDQHYAGQIEEIESGTRWVVDSWFYAHGRLPYLEEATEWLDIPFLFSTSFPEEADG